MTKKALLVAINSYSDPKASLRGCINDITMMNSTLVSYYGFNPANIRLLADSRATKAGIIDRLHWLVADAQPGDSLVFHYSGHGSLITLRDPQGKVLDAQQPIICSWELNWDNPLTFREVGKILVAPDGVNITSVLDCCHSGHDFRELINPGFPKMAGAPNQDVLYRFLSPPMDIAYRATAMPNPTATAPRRMSEDTDILMTGCGVTQTSADAYIKGSYRGAFTYYLGQALAEAKYNIDYVHAISRTNQLLKKAGYSQTPQLEGAMQLSTWPVFGVRI